MNNFKQYFYSSKCCLLPIEKQSAEIAWKRCKSEVLKHLTYKMSLYSPEGQIFEIYEKLYQEIEEKL